MDKVIECTPEFLLLLEHGNTYRFTPDGKYTCPTYKKGQHSFWRIENGEIQYNHGGSLPWYDWNTETSQQAILDWAVDSIILGDSGG